MIKLVLSFSIYFLSLRVFLLGPSHHVYMKGIGLSSLKVYQTPLGDIELDVESILNSLFLSSQ